MAGNSIGGAKAALTNKRIYGKDFYAHIGALGGSKKGVKKGFAIDKRTWWQKLLRRPTHAMITGKMGGKISRRGPAKKTK
jgi:hypothetical protein